MIHVLTDTTPLPQTRWVAEDLNGIFWAVKRTADGAMWRSADSEADAQALAAEMNAIPKEVPD